jgi:GTP-binding protein
VTLFSALKKSGVGDVALALHEWTHAAALPAV